MVAPRKMIGEKFGRLTVLSLAERRPKKPSGTVLLWACQCECGAAAMVSTSNLTGGQVISCGCLRNERVRQAVGTHGCSKSAEYSIWQHMKRRCCDEKSEDYPQWGGRGIKVCDRWLNSFQNFMSDMGVRPIGGTIERINNDGDYEPGNCRWANRTEQANNTRKNLNITINGETKTVPEWAAIAGIPASTIRKRLSRGWAGVDLLRPKLSVGEYKDKTKARGRHASK